MVSPDLGSNAAFCLVIFGVLGIYCEFIWPGKVVPAVAGAGCAVTGLYFLWRASPTPLGLGLLAAAALLLGLDAMAETFWIAGTVGTAALAFGFTRLIAGTGRISPLLEVPCCLAFGMVTMVLNWAGRRARRNKRAGVTAEP